jgi:two-component system chemotaxis response regulator CheB
MVVFAPGDYHLVFDKSGEIIRTRLIQTAPVHYCRPAFDVMLRSLMDVYDNRVLALLLSGMGTDGHDSCHDLFTRGGPVMAQDEASSVVWGMPGAVASSGICTAVANPSQLAQKIAQLAA